MQNLEISFYDTKNARPQSLEMSCEARVPQDTAHGRKEYIYRVPEQHFLSSAGNCWPKMRVHFSV